jgi:hypothetical protein
MKKDKHKTKVLFLIERPEVIDGKDIGSNVFAYFPEIDEGKGRKMCYAHIGQHSVCHADYAAECKPARFAEFKDLMCELESLGYNLDIQNTTEAHRPPRPCEIKFGHGATHYKDFPISQVLRKDRTFKTRVKCPIDGLIYSLK